MRPSEWDASRQMDWQRASIGTADWGMLTKINKDNQTMIRQMSVLAIAITAGWVSLMPLAQAVEPTLPSAGETLEKAQAVCTQQANSRNLEVSSIAAVRQLNTGARMVMNVKNGAYAFTVGCVYTAANNTAALEAVSLRANNNSWRGMGKRVREVCIQAARHEAMKVLNVGTVNVNSDGGVLQMQLRQKGVDFRNASCIYNDATGQADFVMH